MTILDCPASPGQSMERQLRNQTQNNMSNSIASAAQGAVRFALTTNNTET